MSETKRFKKDLDDLDANEFRLKLKNLELKLAKLAHDLSNINDYIYEECNELKRLVQLDTEERIAQLKQLNDIDINQDNHFTSELDRQIDKIQKRNHALIDRIDKHEQDALNASKKNEKQAILFSELKEFVQANKTLDDKSTSKNIKLLVKKIKLEEIEYQCDIFISEFKRCVFGDKLLEFKQTNELSNHLYMQHLMDLEQDFKEIDLSGVLDYNEMHSIQLNLIGEKYLVAFKMKYKQSGLIVYNPTRNAIESRIILDYPHINSIKICDNLIAVHCSEDYALNTNHLLVLDAKLDLVKSRAIGAKFLIGATSECLFLKDDIKLNSECVRYDWSLNELDAANRVHFQMNKPSEPFYLDVSDPLFSLTQLEIQNERIFVRPGSNLKKLDLSECVRVYDLEGRLVCNTRLNGEFRLDAVSKSLIVREDDKLVVFDLSMCEPCKEIRLATNACLKNFMIDANCCLHLFDKFELKIFVSTNKVSI